MFNILILDEVDAQMAKHDEIMNSEDRYSEVQAKNILVYDGMITVELPVIDNQVIAYEPLSNIESGGDEIIVLAPVSRS